MSESTRGRRCRYMCTHQDQAMNPSTREIAERIAGEFRVNHYISPREMTLLADIIDAALKDRDERAAKIAENVAELMRQVAVDAKGERLSAQVRLRMATANEIAAAIRGEE